MTRLLILAVVITSLLAALAWQRGQLKGKQADLDRVAGALTAEQTARREEIAARFTEATRADKLQEALNDEHTKRLAVESDARAADAAGGVLRERARQLAAASRCPAQGPGPAASGPPADTAGDLLADMLERLDQHAGELARYADQARLAGQLCERAYDALTEKPHEQDRTLP